MPFLWALARQENFVLSQLHTKVAAATRLGVVIRQKNFANLWHFSETGTRVGYLPVSVFI